MGDQPIGAYIVQLDWRLAGVPWAIKPPVVVVIDEVFGVGVAQHCREPLQRTEGFGDCGLVFFESPARFRVSLEGGANCLVSFCHGEVHPFMLAGWVARGLSGPPLTYRALVAPVPAPAHA